MKCLYLPGEEELRSAYYEDMEDKYFFDAELATSLFTFFNKCFAVSCFLECLNSFSVISIFKTSVELFNRLNYFSIPHLPFLDK